MSWSRGFFRVWIVASVAWAAVIAVHYYNLVETVGRLNDQRGELVPASCADARGTKGVDYTTIENNGAGPWERYRCWYELRKFRQLYPEYSSLSDDALARKLYAEIGEPLLMNPPVVQAVAWATVPPILILLLGLVLRWVVAGFRAPT